MSNAPIARYDVAAVRAHFPALADGTAYFDGPGGTQTPDVVGRAMYDAITGPLSNRGTVSRAERNAEEIVHAARAALGDLLGADPRGVIVGRSMTQLTFDMARTIAKTWRPGDQIVVTRLDHDANIRSWVTVALAAGVDVRWADFDPESGELHPGEIEKLLGPRTRLVAVTAASNLIGTIPDLARIAGPVHAAGAWLYVDGVHYTAHRPVDMTALGADFYACSPYKFLGPHCGVIAGRTDLLERLTPDKLIPSSDAVPERFELGTLPYELMAGTTAAVDFLAGLVDSGAVGRRDRLLASLAALERHEDHLRGLIETELTRFAGARLYSRARCRTPTLLVTFDGHDPQGIRRALADHRVNAPAGTFYAYEPARHLGLGDTGGVRVGLAPYNDVHDVERLVDALATIVARR